MPMKKSGSAGSSSAEEKFVQIFCDLYGPEKGQYVYLQYPFVDIYGRHRAIDFAMKVGADKVAVEVDGTTWHDPGRVSGDKYADDLLKQNSMVHQNWKVYRWTDTQLEQSPGRVADELVTFLGTSPSLSVMDDDLPPQQGQVFELREHQEEALLNLVQMRAAGRTIALVQGATGSGKSAIGVLDAKSVGGRTLFLAHTKELVQQGCENFKKLWPEASCGLFVDTFRETETQVVCAGIQSVARNLSEFSPTEFDYLIIDECHHAAADSYQRILGYFRTKFTLGLTATPERADGVDLLETFQTLAHKLDIRDAVEAGILVPVRCIRVKTNIDLRDVRINGFKYNNLDLETALRVPSRNRLIVDTYLEYVKGKPAVVFCTSVQHADEVAELFRQNGVNAESISGRTDSVLRRRILQNYEDRRVQVLCACDLLNEGWDSPKTQVLFMARPTMSKTIYMQQLGRGMRTCEGKDFLMVFDFVDNANMFNCPYSLHRLLNVAEYVPGGMVLGKKHDILWDRDMFRQGERPQALIDYPVHATDFEMIDLFNWQDQAQNMISQLELTRRVSAQSETIERYVREGKIKADLEVPVGESRTFKYFKPERVPEFCGEFGWKQITDKNKKELFMDMARQMTMSHSYKPVFILAFLEHMNREGEARIEDVAGEFAAFYEDRVRRGLPAEKKKCIFTEGGYTAKDVENLMLGMPFKRFEDMDFIHHSRYMGTIRLDKAILKRLTEKDRQTLRDYCHAALKKYFEEE